MFVVKLLEKKGVIRFFGISLILAPFVNIIVSFIMARGAQHQWQWSLIKQIMLSTSLPNQIMYGCSIVIGILMLTRVSKAWTFALILMGCYITKQTLTLGKDFRTTWVSGLFFVINIAIFLFIADQLVWKMKKPAGAKKRPDPEPPRPTQPKRKEEKSTESKSPLFPISAPSLNLKPLSKPLVSMESAPEVKLQTAPLNETVLPKTELFQLAPEFVDSKEKAPVELPMATSAIAVAEAMPVDDIDLPPPDNKFEAQEFVDAKSLPTLIAGHFEFNEEPVIEIIPDLISGQRKLLDPVVKPVPIAKKPKMELAPPPPVEVAAAAPLPKEKSKPKYKRILIHFEGIGPWARLMSISTKEIHVRSLLAEPPPMATRKIEMSIKKDLTLKTRLNRRKDADFYFEYVNMTPQELQHLRQWLTEQVAKQAA